MEKKIKNKRNAEVIEPLDGFGLKIQDLTKKINLGMSREQETKGRLVIAATITSRSQCVLVKLTGKLVW